MPDHPSWPAELVEKAKVAAHELNRSSRELPTPDEFAQAVLSALSDDLVPRSLVRELLGNAQFWNDETYKFKRQADALAEASEDLREAGSWEAADESCDYGDNGGEACPPGEPDCLPCVQSAALKKMYAALASYRSKPAPGETK